MKDFHVDRFLSEKAVSLKPSGIRKFFDIVNEFDDVISLTVGQPDFVTPWHIRDAAIKSLIEGKTYYTANAGTKELRGEISNYLSRRFALDYSPDNEIITTIGGSEAIDLAIRVSVEPGDEVIVPLPSFVCYGPLITMCGGVPVHIVTTEKDGFKVTPEALKAVITPKTKLLVLPYPSNPTGAIMEKRDLEAIADVIRETNIGILSDEIYSELTYGTKHISIASIDGMRERTILASGFSKAYAMTGWRLGYVCAPAKITAEIYKIHQYAIMCAPTPSQIGAIEAMKNGDDDVAQMREEYDRRRKYIVGGLREIGLDCYEPRGAFYVFPNISKFGMTSEQFCEKLLYESKVAIFPGAAFGECGEGFARISYAYSVAHITEALERIKIFIEKINQNG